MYNTVTQQLNSEGPGKKQKNAADAEKVGVQVFFGRCTQEYNPGCEASPFHLKNRAAVTGSVTPGVKGMRSVAH